MPRKSGYLSCNTVAREAKVESVNQNSQWPYSQPRMLLITSMPTNCCVCSVSSLLWEPISSITCTKRNCEFVIRMKLLICADDIGKPRRPEWRNQGWLLLTRVRMKQKIHKFLLVQSRWKILYIAMLGLYEYGLKYATFYYKISILTCFLNKVWRSTWYSHDSGEHED